LAFIALPVAVNTVALLAVALAVNNLTGLRYPHRPPPVPKYDGVAPQLGVQQKDVDEAMEKMQSAADRWREHGYDLDWANLVYLGDRNEPADYLTAHGWDVSGAKVNELLTANGYPPFDGDTPFTNLSYISGTLRGK
jgi:hypothetical protein